MTATSKRLEFLEKMTREGSTDPMAWYGLAQEFRSLERNDEALQTFTTLRSMDPSYVPQYLMCGQLLEKMGQLEEAREWLEAGLTAARTKRDSHALSEIQAALDALG